MNTFSRWNPKTHWALSIFKFRIIKEKNLPNIGFTHDEFFVVYQIIPHSHYMLINNIPTINTFKFQTIDIINFFRTNFSTRISP